MDCLDFFWITILIVTVGNAEFMCKIKIDNILLIQKKLKIKAVLIRHSNVEDGSLKIDVCLICQQVNKLSV